jgi:CRISPR-associated protein (TIGR03986 family)
MEKAELLITKTKKGDYEVKLSFSGGKKMPAGFKLKDDSLNGKEVEVLREKGRIIKIICEGKEIYSKEKGRAQSYPKSNQNLGQIAQNLPIQNIYSQAPYNFIPLNTKVVPAQEIPNFDKYHKDRYTGYIEIEIKTLTPFYIRDTLNEEEYKKKLELENNNKSEDRKQYINSDFFSPGGLLRIPGSSLRGMIRTMVEIMSFGKFGFFEDARLYYRAVGDTSTLGIDYREKMVDTSNNYFSKFKAGLLRAKGSNRYEILPSKEINETQIYRINFNQETGIVDGTKDLRLNDFEFKKIYFRPVSPENHTHYQWVKRLKTNKPYQLRYAKLTSVNLTEDSNHTNSGYIISSGHMDKKHMHWVINEPDLSKPPIEIGEDILKSYKNDKQRKAPDIIEELKNKREIPCFYLTDGSGQIISFGHTGMFRLAYEKTIGDHIPLALKDSHITDIAEAIFGNEKTHASRVFFEDAYLDGKPEDALLDTAIPQILSGPKPTCFQHYLEQKPENLKNFPKNLAHYNSNNPIRGYKLYWHRSSNNWIEINQENIRGHQSQYTRITPVKPGSIFKGRIRFENLSKVELGALLFALDLPESCAHKLGMGKPLGLGSARITPRLYLSDRKQRYTDLFAEWDGLNKKTNITINDCKKEFEKYIIVNLKENKSTLWEIDRIKELKCMLDFKNKPADDKTDYLGLEEFRKRKVLPKPTGG